MKKKNTKDKHENIVSVDNATKELLEHINDDISDAISFSINNIRKKMISGINEVDGKILELMKVGMNQKKEISAFSENLDVSTKEVLSTINKKINIDDELWGKLLHKVESFENSVKEYQQAYISMLKEDTELTNKTLKLQKSNYDAIKEKIGVDKLEIIDSVEQLILQEFGKYEQKFNDALEAIAEKNFENNENVLEDHRKLKKDLKNIMDYNNLLLSKVENFEKSVKESQKVLISMTREETNLTSKILKLQKSNYDAIQEKIQINSLELTDSVEQLILSEFEKYDLKFSDAQEQIAEKTFKSNENILSEFRRLKEDFLLNQQKLETKHEKEVEQLIVELQDLKALMAYNNLPFYKKWFRKEK